MTPSDASWARAAGSIGLARRLAVLRVPTWISGPPAGEFSGVAPFAVVVFVSVRSKGPPARAHGRSREGGGNVLAAQLGLRTGASKL